MNWRPNRRQALAGMASVAATMLVRPAPAWSVVTMGDARISTISDGNLVLPMSFAFPDVPADELAALLSADGKPVEALEPPCNLTLVERGDRKILFDAGSGANFMPSAGKIADAMAAAGLSADDITDVIFTHGHPDHLWGIVDDFDEIAFPSAQLYFPRAEWDFWYDENTVDKMSDARKTFAIGAKNRLEAMEDQVTLIDWGSEVLAGIEAVNSAGHTPGHTSYVVHGENGAGAMIIGDAMTNEVISFQRPRWPSGSDQDTEMGIATRVSMLDRLVTDKMMLVGFHLPGGIGQVERDGEGYRFVAQPQ